VGTLLFVAVSVWAAPLYARQDIGRTTVTIRDSSPGQSGLGCMLLPWSEATGIEQDGKYRKRRLHIRATGRAFRLGSLQPVLPSNSKAIESAP
jgi:hypothetical protein